MLEVMAVETNTVMYDAVAEEYLCCHCGEWIRTPVCFHDFVEFRKQHEECSMAVFE